MTEHTYSVYIISNKNLTTFYTGVTNHLPRRMWEHKNKHKPKSFSSRYNLDRLLYFETYQYINAAIHREKQLKKWAREWKLDLIRKENHLFLDLSEEWYEFFESYCEYT